MQNYNSFSPLPAKELEVITTEPLNYQIVTDQFIQNDPCCAVAFNNESNIMVARCEGKIKVFKFQKGQLEETQVLIDKTVHLSSFYFMKQSNKFISGNDFSDILVWSVNDSKQWYCEGQLSGHNDDINQIIMNKNEDLIIACSDDCDIKLWENKNKWKCSQTLRNHAEKVWSICLNESEDQLASCGEDKRIIIFRLNCQRKWKKMQTIQLQQYGYRLCFIGNNFLTFQQSIGVKMDIFKWNEEKLHFWKYADVKIDQERGCYRYFPQQFIKQKQILLNKIGCTVYLMRLRSKDEFVVEQKIKFDTYCIFGAMTDDGEYLVTWDDKSKKFQVRQQNFPNEK